MWEFRERAATERRPPLSAGEGFPQRPLPELPIVIYLADSRALICSEKISEFATLAVAHCAHLKLSQAQLAGNRLLERRCPRASRVPRLSGNCVFGGFSGTENEQLACCQ